MWKGDVVSRDASKPIVETTAAAVETYPCITNSAITPERSLCKIMLDGSVRCYHDEKKFREPTVGAALRILASSVSASSVLTWLKRTRALLHWATVRAFLQLQLSLVCSYALVCHEHVGERLCAPGGM